MVTGNYWEIIFAMALVMLVISYVGYVVCLKNLNHYIEYLPKKSQLLFKCLDIVGREKEYSLE